MTGAGEGAAKSGNWLEELADPILRLTPVDWGFGAIAILSAVAFIWVMGAPPDKRPPAAVAAIVIVGVAAAGLVLGAAGARPA